MKRDKRRVNCIARPPEWGGFKLLTEGRARLPHADSRQHFLTDWMLFGGAGMAHRAERLVGAVAGSLHCDFPCGRVCFAKSREQARERGRDRIPQLGVK